MKHGKKMNNNANSEKLTLWQTVFISVNVMFGSGVFINTVNLTKIAGAFGFISYVIVALILLPLIFSVTALIKKYPEGGFYVYAAKELGPLFGFLSAWAYFTGKLASATLLIHVFSLLIQTIIVPLQVINPFIIDLMVIIIFMWLNHYALQTGTRITYAFIFLKVAPIAFAILSSIYLIGQWRIPPETLLWSGIPSTIPLVLYAFVGFETACSLSLTIKDPERNAARAILYSFFFTITITILYQFLTFLAIGPELMKQYSFLDIFPTFFSYLFSKENFVVPHLLNLLHIAGAAAALGGSYGMIFSNQWNLYILAENNHTFFSKLFTKKNEFGIPFSCVLAQGFICLGYLIATYAHQIVLQQMSVFGVSIAFMLSVLSLLKIHYSDEKKLTHAYIPWLALASCIALLAMCIHNFIHWGLIYLLLSGLILFSGVSMFYVKKFQRIP